MRYLHITHHTTLSSSSPRNFASGIAHSIVSSRFEERPKRKRTHTGSAAPFLTARAKLSSLDLVPQLGQLEKGLAPREIALLLFRTLLATALASALRR